MATESHRWAIAAAAIAAELLLGACSSSSSSIPTTPPPSPTPAPTTAAPATPGATSSVCQAAAELRTSVDALLHIHISKGTADEIKSDLANVEAKFTAL